MVPGSRNKYYEMRLLSDKVKFKGCDNQNPPPPLQAQRKYNTNWLSKWAPKYLVTRLCFASARAQSDPREQKTFSYF